MGQHNSAKSSDFIKAAKEIPSIVMYSTPKLGQAGNEKAVSNHGHQRSENLRTLLFFSQVFTIKDTWQGGILTGRSLFQNLSFLLSYPFKLF